MFTAERPSHLLLVTMVLALGNCEEAPVSRDGPRFRLPNGTTLENWAELVFQLGAPIELYCTGQAQDLEITDVSSDVLMQTYFVNETSVKSVTEHAPCDTYSYQCVDRETNETASVYVIVNSLPVVTSFKCISENLQSVLCNWTTDNNYVFNASFDYVENGVSFHLCKWEDVYFPQHKVFNCVWKENNAAVPAVAFPKYVYDNITFSVSACVKLGCTNHTFEVQLIAILKLEAPIPTTNQKYNFTQRHTTLVSSFSNIVCVQSGIHEFEVNHTGVFNDWNYFELQLPCADTFYEVRASVKPTWAVGSEYWSEPATVSFTSLEAADPALDAANPTCTHTHVALTPDVMLTYAEMFRAKITEKLRTLREKIQSMKLKADKFKQRNEGN